VTPVVWVREGEETYPLLVFERNGKVVRQRLPPQNQSGRLTPRLAEQRAHFIEAASSAFGTRREGAEFPQWQRIREKFRREPLTAPKARDRGSTQAKYRKLMGDDVDDFAAYFAETGSGMVINATNRLDPHIGRPDYVPAPFDDLKAELDRLSGAIRDRAEAPRIRHA
jgi:hypothetical protein